MLRVLEFETGHPEHLYANSKWWMSENKLENLSFSFYKGILDYYAQPFTARADTLKNSSQCV